MATCLAPRKKFLDYSSATICGFLNCGREGEKGGGLASETPRAGGKSGSTKGLARIVEALPGYLAGKWRADALARFIKKNSRGAAVLSCLPSPGEFFKH
jgi:hypothetical protein